MKKISDVKSRVDAYRTKTAACGEVRADVYLSKDLSDKIKKIAADNKWKYLETVAAFAALGVEVFEQGLDLHPDQVIQDPSVVSALSGSLRNLSDASNLAVSNSVSSGAEANYPKTLSYISKPETRSVLSSFIEKRRCDLQSDNSQSNNTQGDSNVKK